MSLAERRQRYLCLSRAAATSRLKGERAPTMPQSFTTLSDDWEQSVQCWRAERERKASRSSGLDPVKSRSNIEVRGSRCDINGSDEEPLSEGVRKLSSSLKQKRMSDFLMADDLLQQAHRDLDALLEHSSSRPKSSIPSKVENATLASYRDLYLKKTSAPDGVAYFDCRLPFVVPASYFTKALDIVELLDPSRIHRTLAEQRNSNGSAGPGSDKKSGVISSEITTTSTASSCRLRIDAGCDKSSNQSHEVELMVSLDPPLDLMPRGGSKDISDAIAALTSLIESLTPNHWSAVLFNCRAACHYAARSLRLCLKDSAQAADITRSRSSAGSEDASSLILALRRTVACFVVLCDIDHAKESLSELIKVVDECPSNAHIKQSSLQMVRCLESLVESKNRGLLNEALASATKLVVILPESPQLLEKRLELLADLGQVDALDCAAAAVLKFPNQAGLWYWYGLLQSRCSCCMEDMENAQRSLQRAVSCGGLDGHAAAQAELQRARYLESKAALAAAFMRSKRWRQAISELTILITSKGVSSGMKLHFSWTRAKAFIALGRPHECISDATYVLNHIAVSKGSNPTDSGGNPQTGAPQGSEVLRLLAECHVLLKEWDRVTDYAKRALDAAVTSQSRAEARQFLSDVDRLRYPQSETADRQRTAAPSPPPNPRPQSASAGARHASARKPEAEDWEFDSDTEDSSWSQPKSANPPRAPKGTQKPMEDVKPLPHYQTLGVPKDASTAAITKAYHKQALQWHPDRWVSETESKRRKAEDMFKALNTAYQTLCDPESRRNYDCSR